MDAGTLAAIYPRVETTTDHERSITHTTGDDGSVAVWARFVQSVGAKVSGRRSASVHTDYAMDAVETAYFVTDPPLEEIEARCKAARVRAVVKAGCGRMPGMRHPVYMVTGLMVAKGLVALQEKGNHQAGAVEVSGDVPTPAGDVGLGANLSKSASTQRNDRWKAGEDIVFAYQLLKIEVKGWKGTKIEYDELRHKAAYLGISDEEDDDDEDSENEIEGQVTTSTVNKDNIPVSRSSGGTTIVELGEGESMITCIAAVDI